MKPDEPIRLALEAIDEAQKDIEKLERLPILNMLEPVLKNHNNALRQLAKAVEQSLAR